MAALILSFAAAPAFSQPSALSASKTSLTFGYDIGSTPPPAQTVSIWSNPLGLTLEVSASAWIQVSADRSTTPVTLTVSVNPGQLQPSTHNGQITISAPGANKINIAVALVVSSTLSFTYQPGFEPPSPKCFLLDHPPGQPFSISTSGQPWFAVSPAQGVTPATICVSVNTEDLDSGDYRGTADISAGPLKITVALRVLNAPRLSAGPRLLTFNYDGATVPPAQRVLILSTNPDRGLAYEVATDSDSPWLKLSAVSGVTPGELSVSVNAEGLPPGSHQVTIVVTARSALGSPQSITVVLVVPDVRLSVSPSTLTYSYEKNSELPSPQSILVTAAGAAGAGNKLNFAARIDTGAESNWLTLNATEGTTPATLTASVNVSNLQSGTYSGTVEIQSPSASNGVQRVRVVLTVSEPTLIVSPGRLSFDMRTGSGAILSKTAALERSSKGTALNYTAAVETGTEWLSIETGGAGSTPAALKVSVNGSRLQRGIYNGSIVITSEGAGNSPVRVPVSLSVRDKPTILVRPSSLAFNFQPGYATPAPQTISVSADTTQFSALASASGATWLRVDPADGTSPQTLTVSVIPEGLEEGTYNGTIRINAPDGMNPVSSVDVTLTVDNRPKATITPSSLAFEVQAGSVIPFSQNLTLHTNGGVISANAAATTRSGGNWLTSAEGVSAGTVDGITGVVSPTPGTLAVFAHPAGLAPGTYSGTVLIMLDTTSPPLTIPVTLTVRPNVLIVPQIAAGADWKTTIILLNTDREAAPFTIKFWQPDGRPIVLPLEIEGSVSEIKGSIPAGGMRVIETGGRDSMPAQGWAEVIGERSIGGTAILRQRNQSGYETEGAVPISQATGKRFLMPFDNTEGFTTSVALANPGTAAAAVSLNARDENGRLISNESLQLLPRTREVFALGQKFERLANRRGVVEFTTIGPDLAASGLRFNSRGSFVSLASAAPAASGTEMTSQSISQIADGSGWKTTIILMNPGNEPVAFSVIFRYPNGEQMQLPVAGVGPVKEYSDVIAAGGVRVLESEGASATLLQGWAQLVSSRPLTGATIFRQRNQAGTDSEGAVAIPPAPVIRTVAPFDNTGGFVTSFALLNESAEAGASFSFVFRDEGGQTISTETYDLGPSGRAAFMLPELFGATKGRRGTAEIFGSPFSFFSLRFNPLGSFTSIAPIPK